MVLEMRPTSGRSEWDGKPQRVQNKEQRKSGLKDRRRQQGLGKWLGHHSACRASMKAPVIRPGTVVRSYNPTLGHRGRHCPGTY